jgi:polyhydroxyalkanoate synthase
MTELLQIEPAASEDQRAKKSETRGDVVALRATATPALAAGPRAQEDVRDSYSVTALTDVIDRSLHATAARFTGGLSPAALALAYLDWATHLTFAPGKRMQLVDKAMRKMLRFGNYAWRDVTGSSRAAPCIEPLPQDHRFSAPEWQQWPFNFIYQAFLLQQQWWHNATSDIRGTSRKHGEMVEFAGRQVLDMFAPSNIPWLNPEVLRRTMSAGGLNLVKGFENFVEDWERSIGGKPPVGAEKFAVGRNVAVTPGKVVYRNRLIELIQYAPTTTTVRAEPVLIVPAWIMKYYILDLSPHNSLVKFLVGQGYTVFMISWKNPEPEDRELGLEDYRSLGIMSALDVVGKIVPDQKIHAAGYCLGGTLLSIAAAAMARDNDARLGTLTLFASQTDFTEAGELTLFIDESQLAFLEDMMWEQGFLDSRQMAGAFEMLRSNDLVWSKVIHDYLLGTRQPMTDLMAWNADATRMPYRMHSEYLRRLFHDNDLAEGHFAANDRPISLGDIHVPIFAVGTERDHVAPWRSTYKINLQTETEITYVLATGGHNAGIVSEPGHPGHAFRVSTRPAGQHSDPDLFLQRARQKQGSWWPEWVAWLDARSGAKLMPPPAEVNAYPALGDAPGTYVFQQ